MNSWLRLRTGTQSQQRHSHPNLRIFTTVTSKSSIIPDIMNANYCTEQDPRLAETYGERILSPGLVCCIGSTVHLFCLTLGSIKDAAKSG